MTIGAIVLIVAVLAGLATIVMASNKPRGNKRHTDEFTEELVRRCREDGMSEEEIQKWIKQL